jgi:hypothetical protein
MDRRLTAHAHVTAELQQQAAAAAAAAEAQVWGLWCFCVYVTYIDTLIVVFLFTYSD